MIAVLLVIYIRQLYSFCFIKSHGFFSTTSLNSYLNQNIASQDEAIAKFSGYFELWSSRQDRKPLLISLAGGSRTGKTYFSTLLRDYFFELDSTAYYKFDAPDYEYIKKDPKEGNKLIRTIQNVLRQSCDLSLFIFDELQTADSSVFSRLSEIINNSGKVYDYQNPDNLLVTSNSIFIFIFDITQSIEIKIIESASFHQLSNSFYNQQLMGQLSRIDPKGSFTNLFATHIPFLPFTKTDLILIFKLLFNKHFENRRNIVEYITLDDSPLFLDELLDIDTGIISYDILDISGHLYPVSRNGIGDLESLLAKLVSFIIQCINDLPPNILLYKNNVTVYYLNNEIIVDILTHEFSMNLYLVRRCLIKRYIFKYESDVTGFFQSLIDRSKIQKSNGLDYQISFC